MSEWINYKLGDIGSFTNGINKDKNSFGFGFPFVNLMDIFDKDIIYQKPLGLVNANHDELSRYSIKEGDILFVRSSVKLDGVGKVCTVANSLENTTFSGFVIRFRQSELFIDKIFASYYLNSSPVRRQVISKATLSANSNINQESLKSIQIHLPNLEHQRKIAKILFATDAVIEQTQSAIAKYKAIKQGLLHDLFTCGLDAHGDLRSEKTHKFKDSKLGRIPMEWNVNKLEDTCTHIVDCPHSTPNYLDYGVLVARTFSIKDGRYDLDNSSFISEKEYNERIQRLEPKSGDIIFTREAPVGEAFVIPENMRICLGQRVMLLRMNSQNNPNYLLEVLYSKSTKLRFDNLVSGTTNPHLNVGDVKKFEFVFPKLEEQNKIVKRLSSLNNKIQTEETLLQKYQSIKRGLMGDLLGGKKEVV